MKGLKIPTSILKPHSANKLWKDKVFRVVQRDGAKCKKCGHPNPVNLSVDHIRAVSLGGTDAISNLQILCWRCHRKKDKDVPRLAMILRKRVQRKFGDVLENEATMTRTNKLK